MFFTIVTSIQPPTPSLRRCNERTLSDGGTLIVVGDRGSPAQFELPGAEFISLEKQRSSQWLLAKAGPVAHYARKNIGYLEAIQRGARCIYETDDDNCPLPGWRVRSEETRARHVTERGWFNVFQQFSDRHIWPRGFPLDQVHSSIERNLAIGAGDVTVRAPIQQGLANGAADVDAIWRLVLDKHIEFREGASLLLAPNCWCPFNSQSTWWFPIAYPLLYLPSHVSFRMTDIWRSFVAQRCLWELGRGVVFHGPEVLQDRNAHDLLRDFEQEVPGYLGNRKLCDLLDRVVLSSAPAAVGLNVIRCYEALVAAGFVRRDELPLVEAWLRDLTVAAPESQGS